MWSGAENGAALLAGGGGEFFDTSADAPVIEDGAAPGAPSVQLDLDLSPADVLSRIESVVMGVVSGVCTAGAVPDLHLVARGARNADLAPPPAAATSAFGNASSSGASDGAAASGELVMALGGRTTRKSLTASKGAGALAYVRVFKVLAAVHELLKSGRTATQRDLYYKVMHCPMPSASLWVTGPQTR